MAKYRWTCQIEVDADDDIEAEERIGEHLEEMYADPDTPFSHGKLEKVLFKEKDVSVSQDVKTK